MTRWMAGVGAGAALLAAAYAGGARADSQYGVIVYSAPTDSVNIRIECDTLEECESDALQSCRENAGEPDACEVLLWFRDACGAFARAGNGAHGTGWGTDQDIARKFAVSTCKEYGGEDCVADSSACSNGAFTIN